MLSSSLWSKIRGAAFVTLLLCIFHQGTSAADMISTDDCCATAQDATAFALIYGYPLQSFAKLVYGLLYIVKAPNKPLALPNLSSPTSTAVVAPNADTLYTAAAIDLSHSDVVVTVPPIPDSRYWSFAFYDPYGNQFATLSDIVDSPSGRYLIRRADDVKAYPGLKSPTLDESLSQYKGVVNYPTNYGILLNRLLVRHNTSEELEYLHQIQAKIQLKETPRQTTQPLAVRVPRLTMDLIKLDALDETHQLGLTAKLAPHNQPIVAADRYRVAGILGLAGLAPSGMYTQPTGVDLLEASKAANATVLAASTNPANLNPVGNGWVLQKHIAQGNFRTNYAFRFSIAEVGYLQLNPIEALYPTYVKESQKGVTIGASEALLITFSGRPPLKEPEGFWSLTLYGPSGFFIANKLNRYAIGDRNNITYPNGEAVYGQGASGNSDRSFQILIQPADVAPPENWTSNWLPGPPGGGQIRFPLRWYAPTPAMSNQSYVYPRLQKINAIK